MSKGLEGIAAAETGRASAGYPDHELAPHATFEETVWLLWNGSLPEQVETFRRDFARRRVVPPATFDRLAAAAVERIDIMDVLRMALCGTVGQDEEDARNVFAILPTVVAAYCPCCAA